MNIEINSRKLKERFITSQTKTELNCYKKRVNNIDVLDIDSKIILASSNSENIIKIHDMESNNTIIKLEKKIEIKLNKDEAVVNLKFLNTINYNETNSINYIYLALLTTDKTLKILSFNSKYSNKIQDLDDSITLHNDNYNYYYIVSSDKNKIANRNFIWINLYSIVSISKEEDSLLIFNLDYKSNFCKNIIFEKQVNLKNKISDLIIDKSNNILITCSIYNSCINIVSLENYDHIYTLELNNYVCCLAVYNDSRQNILATGDNHSLITLYDIKNSFLPFKVLKRTEYNIKKLQFSSCGMFIACLYDEAVFDIFNVDIEECIFTCIKKLVISDICLSSSLNVMFYLGEESIKEEGSISIIKY